MKSNSPTRLWLMLTATVLLSGAAALLLLQKEHKQDDENRPAAESRPSTSDSQQGHLQANRHSTTPKSAHAPSPSPQRPIEWLASICAEKIDVEEKLAKLQSERSHHSITALWQDLMKEATWLQNGQIPGCQPWQSAMIFNALLDALVEAGAKAQRADQSTEEIVGIFHDLVANASHDGILRDYAIQRSLMLAGETLRHDSAGRQTLLQVTLQELTPQNLPQSPLGTTLNTLLSYQDSWSAKEHRQIQDRVEELIANIPPNFFKPSTPTSDEAPNLQVRIPLLTAIGGWQIHAAYPLLEAAIHSGDPSLQIPAIAAWSKFPQAKDPQNPLHRQIQQWATSQSPLKYAAQTALHAP